jgi:hypothetical protein
MYKIATLSLFLLGFACFSSAQRRFEGGVVAGLSASQIDGDLSAGYNKLGLVAGLRVNALLSKRSAGSIELLFSQRGAQSELVRDQFNLNNYALTLNYIEVPIQWHFKDWLIEGDDASENYYRMSFNIGLSYSRLFGYRYDGEPDYFVGAVMQADQVKENDLSFVTGANVFFTRHFGITLRYVRSIGVMYNPADYAQPKWSRSWNGHCLYFQTCYLF